jgi:hypothetical protein
VRGSGSISTVRLPSMHAACCMASVRLTRHEPSARFLSPVLLEPQRTVACEYTIVVEASQLRVMSDPSDSTVPLVESLNWS